VAEEFDSVAKELDFVLMHVHLNFTTTTWKTHFGNGRRSPLVTSNVPVTDQVLQLSQER
jgi:hypothetical protein